MNGIKASGLGQATRSVYPLRWNHTILFNFYAVVNYEGVPLVRCTSVFKTAHIRTLPLRCVILQDVKSLAPLSFTYPPTAGKLSSYSRTSL